MRYGDMKNCKKQIIEIRAGTISYIVSVDVVNVFICAFVVPISSI